MAARRKTRQTLEDILASCSDMLFPAKMGMAPVRIDSRDCDGDTALHVLLRRGNAYGIKRLIEAGADVNAVGDMGETPLHIAVGKEDVEAIRLLLAAGADPTTVSEFGQTPLSRAEAIGRHLGKLFD